MEYEGVTALIRSGEFEEEIERDLFLETKSGALLTHYLRQEKFGFSHVETFDNWINKIAENTIKNKYFVNRTGKVVIFDNLRVLPARYTKDGKVYPMTPQYAREQGLNYEGEWYIDIYLKESLEAPEEVGVKKRTVNIALIPIMLHSGKCILRDKSPQELALLGEDPNDPPGYFIVGGSEKLVLFQEQLVTNRIFLMNIDTKGTVITRILASTAKGAVLTELSLNRTGNMIRINLPLARMAKQREKTKTINVLRIYRLFSVAYDMDPLSTEDIIQYISLFLPSDRIKRKKCLLKLATGLLDYNAITEDVELVMRKLEKTNLTYEQKIEEMRTFLDTDLFPHLNNIAGISGESVEERNARIITSKLYLLSIMVARFLEYLAGFRQVDDRDSWSNKKIEGAGRMMESLFRNAWNKTLKSIKSYLEVDNPDLDQIATNLRKSVIITKSFRESFTGTEWGVVGGKGGKMKTNITQTLSRDGVVATYAHMSTIDVEIPRDDRQESLRLVQNSQYGFVDPTSTPENVACLQADTLVVSGDGSFVPISEVKNEDLMLTLNPTTGAHSITPVMGCFTKISEIYGKSVYTLELLSGERVTATSDHPFLTLTGFRPLSSLVIGVDKVALTYVPIPFEHLTFPFPLMNEEIFGDKMAELGLELSKQIKIKTELTQLGPLELTSQDARFPILARMVGYALPDRIDWETKTLYLIFNDLEDCQTFVGDAKTLGFTLFPDSVINKKECQYRTRISGGLMVLFSALGLKLNSGAYGEKAVPSLPSWVPYASILAKREFLSGLMGRLDLGGDESRRFLHDLPQSEHQALRELFTSFKVNYPEDLGADDLALAGAFFYKIGYRYNNQRVNGDLRFLAYLRYKTQEVNPMSYEEWRQITVIERNCLFVPVASLTKVTPCLVSDYTTRTPNTHTIICANGIVSHNCGIIKNQSLTTKTSLERDDAEITRLLIGESKFGLGQMVSMNYEPDQAKLIINGKFLGWCDGPATYDYLIRLRRSVEIPSDVSIIKEEDWIYVETGPSRLLRPLLIINPSLETREVDGIVLVKNEIPNLDELLQEYNSSLLSKGLMEYLSPWEQEYIKLATSVEKIEARNNEIESLIEKYQAALDDYVLVERGKEILARDVEGFLTLQAAEERIEEARKALIKFQNSNRPYTHCELDSLSILSISAGLIPWPNHNQAPRNTYQTAMGKQALGIPHRNYRSRMDVEAKVLAFPTRPLVETSLYGLIDLDSRGPGETVDVAVMAMPDTEEDSFIFKKEFLDNGGMRYFKYFTYKTVVHHSVDVTEILTRPALREGEASDQYKYIQYDPNDKNNPMNGLPKIGSPLKPGHCVIGKVQMIPGNKEVRNESVILRMGDEGIVEKVVVIPGNMSTTVIVKLRNMRIPEEGDKYAPRNAQKGTIGIVLPEINLPCDERGIAPDIIINVHSIPSRMTLEYLDEILAGKHAALRGLTVNANAFVKPQITEYRNTLKNYGLNEFGYSIMRSGNTGKPLEVPIYHGLVFFQSLKHHVKDKIQYRGLGPIRPVTHQASKGKGNRGGLRFGEMERDAAIAQGSSAFLRERLMFASDAYQAIFCRRCKSFVVFDARIKRYAPCHLCGNTKDFGRCIIPYAAKLLIQLLAAMGIFLRPDFINSEDLINNILRAAGTLGFGLADINNILQEADEGYAQEVEEIDNQNIQTSYRTIFDKSI